MSAATQEPHFSIDKQRVDTATVGYAEVDLSKNAIDPQGTLIVFRPSDGYTSEYIRPMAVSPLNHPEGVLSPWGFSFSGPVESSPYLDQGGQHP